MSSGSNKKEKSTIFFSSYRARSRLGRSLKRLVVVNYSQVVREQVKCKKSDVFQMPKQNHSETQTQTKNTTRRKTPSNLGETLRFQKFRKMKSSERLVPLHDDIAIPASRKMSQVAHSWKKWYFCIIPVVEQGEQVGSLTSW